MEFIIKYIVNLSWFFSVITFLTLIDLIKNKKESKIIGYTFIVFVSIVVFLLTYYRII